MNVSFSTIVIYTFCINIFTFYIHFLYYTERLQSFFVNEFYEDYDFIIVGCGTAGSLISTSFSEHNISYVCLEAGGSGSRLLDIPVLGPLLQESIHDWQYTTVKQDNACGAMDGKVCKWPSGKIIGGSSRLNNMVHLRGNPDDYISWFGGEYDRSYFEEQFSKIEKRFLPIKQLKFKSQLSDAVLQAAENSGFPVRSSNKHNYGFSETIINQKNGGRWSTSHSAPFKHIISNAFVERIIIDRDLKLARGVKFSKFGRSHKIFARKGVIVSSGAIGSPKLLLLSGIGPKNHLNELDIPLMADLMVGQNLQDHIATGLDLVLLDRPPFVSLLSIVNPINAWNYFTQGTGPWTIPGCEALAVLSAINKTEEELGLMVLPFGLMSDLGTHLKGAFGLSDETWEKYFISQTSKTSVTILSIVLKPKSRGIIKLKTKNPHDKPIIDPKYLSDEYDIKVLLYGIKVIKKLINTDQMKVLGAELNDKIFPGCENFSFDSEDYWKCYVRHLSFTSYHPGGTCKMGSPRDSNSVVDYNFKIHGMKNVYVVDASVFPSLPSANPNAAVAMLAQIFVNNIVPVSSSRHLSIKETYQHVMLHYVKIQTFCDKSVVI